VKITSSAVSQTNSVYSTNHIKACTLRFTVLDIITTN